MPLAKLTTMLLLGAAPLLAQARHEHHPPRSTEEYIKALEDPARDEWQKPQEVLERLELKPGFSVADLGAGSGYFTLRLAWAVGPSGKVYAVDIDSEMLEHIAHRAREERVSNIQTVLAKANDPKLAPSSVDLILVCDTLHHIQHREAYYPLLARALKPGGRLVNIDFEKRELPVGPPVTMKIDKADMVQEAEAAGFHLVRQLQFLNYQYFLEFAR